MTSSEEDENRFNIISQKEVNSMIDFALKRKVNKEYSNYLGTNIKAGKGVLLK